VNIRRRICEQNFDLGILFLPLLEPFDMVKPHLDVVFSPVVIAGNIDPNSLPIKIIVLLAASFTVVSQIILMICP